MGKQFQMRSDTGRVKSFQRAKIPSRTQVLGIRNADTAMDRLFLPGTSWLLPSISGINLQKSQQVTREKLAKQINSNQHTGTFSHNKPNTRDRQEMFNENRLSLKLTWPACSHKSGKATKVSQVPICTIWITRLTACQGMSCLFKGEGFCFPGHINVSGQCSHVISPCSLCRPERNQTCYIFLIFANKCQENEIIKIPNSCFKKEHHTTLLTVQWQKLHHYF